MYKIFVPTRGTPEYGSLVSQLGDSMDELGREVTIDEAKIQIGDQVDILLRDRYPEDSDEEHERLGKLIVWSAWADAGQDRLSASQLETRDFTDEETWERIRQNRVERVAKGRWLVRFMKGEIATDHPIEIEEDDGF